MAESAITLDAGLRALKAVQAVFPGALLAGGFLRDIMFDRTPKDIDIFVPYAKDFPPLPPAWVVMGGAAEYIERTEVDSIFDVLGFELPVQVIVLAPGLDVLDRIKGHDFNFCQVWHDGIAMCITQSFSRAFYEKEVVLEHCESQAEFERSMRRWKRLSVKYPEMALVIPDRFQHFELFL